MPNGFFNNKCARRLELPQRFCERHHHSRRPDPADASGQDLLCLEQCTRFRAASASVPTTRRGTLDQPFATLAYAVSQCSANAGDMIFLMPLHAETVSSATALTINTAGIAIIGLGSGTNRPTITLGTATTATINVTAANVAISSVLFKANLADIASLFTTTTAKSFTLDTCEFRDNSSILNFARIVDTNATSNDTDDLTITNCAWYGLGATANSCLVKMDGTNARLTVTNNFISHAATTDAGLMPIATGKVVTSAIITGNIMSFVGATSATTGTVITTDGTTNSGMIARNLIQSLDATSEILVTASSGFLFSQNYSSAVADKSGYLLPAADS
jgi:hypothetical protein